MKKIAIVTGATGGLGKYSEFSIEEIDQTINVNCKAPVLLTQLCIPYMGEGGRDLGVTNLNQIDIPYKYTNFSIERVQFIPPSVSYTKNIIGISTFQDVLTVSRKMENC